MKITLLHLSDIHLRGTDSVTSRANDIASCVFAAARESDACLLVVTGDIAYSGAAVEYKPAESFILAIVHALKREGCALVETIVVPGNHDCALKPEDKARTVVIERVIANPSLATDDGIIAACTKAQMEFFAFRARVTTAAAVFDSPLWTEYEWIIGTEILRVSALNAAWMSRIPEVPGQLVFPPGPHMDQLASPSTVRIALLHHPLNWYCQSTYHPLRQALRTHADAILSGHEHIANSGQVSESSAGDSLFYEAAALQPHDVNATPGFSLLQLDTSSNEVSERRFVLTQTGINADVDEYVKTLRTTTSESAGKYEISHEFLVELREPGGDFVHPKKIDGLDLDDVFVYPDVVCLGVGDARSDPADAVLGRLAEGTRLLFMAGERAGKTTLLKRAFQDIHAKRLVPIFIRASEITSTSTKELQKALQRETQRIYARPHNAENCAKSERVALIDNIDKLPGGAKGIARVLQHLKLHFHAVVATASDGFALTELIGKDAASIASEFETYSILPFGHRLRHQLIRKWCLCGNVTTNQQLDQQVHAMESILESVVGRNLVPAQPIYLLILLQSCDRQQQSELQNSGFAHYYQYLITTSLGQAGVKADELNELFNYLANLAWFFRSASVNELGQLELRGFNASFCEKFTTVDLDKRLNLLVRAKVLRRHGEHYSFTYPYIYYFFLGKYLADNLHVEEVRGLVSNWCQNLHQRNNAHAVLFLTHHRNDLWVIEQVAAVLKATFPEPEHLPMRFDGDVDGINALVDEASELLLAAPNVDKNQENFRRMQDDLESEDEKNSDSDDAEGDIAFVNDLFRLMKTCEILGQILKNYYGSLERTRKEEYIKQVFDGPLRLVRMVIEAVSRDPDGFVREIDAAMQRGAPGTEESVEPRKPLADPTAQKSREADEAARRKDFARRTGYVLLGQMATGVVARAAQFVGTERLAEDIHAVVKSNSTNAYRLIQAATNLTRAGDLPVESLRRLAEDVESNPFVFRMLQSLGAWHIRLFHMSEQDRQRLCAHLRIEISDAKFIDFHAGGRRLTKGNG